MQHMHMVFKMICPAACDASCVSACKGVAPAKGVHVGGRRGGIVITHSSTPPVLSWAPPQAVRAVPWKLEGHVEHCNRVLELARLEEHKARINRIFAALRAAWAGTQAG